MSDKNMLNQFLIEWCCIFICIQYFFFRKAKPALWHISKITILPVYAYTCYLQFFERIKNEVFMSIRVNLMLKYLLKIKF